MGQLKRQLVIWSAIAATTAVLPGLALADNASPDFGGHHGRGQDQRNSKLSVAGRAMSRAEKAKDAYGMEIRGRSGDKPTDAGGMVRFAHRGDTASEGLVGDITCLSKDSSGIVSVTGIIKRSAKRDSKGDKQFKPGAPGAPGGGTTAASDDDGTALLDELAPLNADETADLAAADPAPPALPGAPAAPGMPSAPGQDPNKKHDHKGGGELAGKAFAFTIDVPGKPQHFSQPTIGDKATLAACSGGGAPMEVTRGRFRTREADAKDTKGDNNKDGGDGHGWFGGHRRGGDKGEK